MAARGAELAHRAARPWTVFAAVHGLWGFARRKPLGAAGGAILLLMTALAVGAPAFSPYDPLALHYDARFATPGAQFLMGTDKLGRDILSRVIWGARVSLGVGIGSIALGTLAGVVLGVVSAYWGGVLDLAVQRVMDVLMAFPTLLLALVIVAVLGGSMTNLVLAIGIVMTPQMARVVRSSVLSIKESQYIEAARALGARDLRIVATHVLPNVLAPVIIVATAGLARAIITEASLSFLGLGAPPPTPSWGADLSGMGRTYFEQGPWAAIFPGLAISFAVLGINLLGDGLRDAWDPRLAGTRR